MATVRRNLNESRHFYTTFIPNVTPRRNHCPQNRFICSHFILNAPPCTMLLATTIPISFAMLRDWNTTACRKSMGKRT
jgi:hypothetical protein